MRWMVVLLLATLLFALGIGTKAHAQTTALGQIVIEQPWARATPGRATTGAAYMTLTNNAASADRLMSATTSLADSIQFHRETEENGVSRMREVRDVALQPGAKVVFKPGELHMMIVGLKQPLKEGQTFPLTLQFEKAGSVELTVPIEKIGAMQHHDMSSMSHAPDNVMNK